MMEFNFLIILIAALVPLLVGFVWYNPKVFGNAWMKSAGITEEQAKGANMGLIFGLTFVFSFLAAFSLNFMVIHQWHIFSLVANDPGINDPTSEVSTWMKGIMDKVGANFRTFGHGAFHGFLIGLFFVLPIIGTGSLFERKSFKYVAINTGYWAVSLALMGGIICQWA